MTAVADDAEIEALVVDRYLDALLARRPVEVRSMPADLAAAAAMLSSDLPRFHPSFRFEERLATRLAEVTAPARASDQSAAIVAFPGQMSPPGHPLRPVVIGSVLTSAAISLLGAAFVAWRRSHPTAEAAMARAVRAVARTRIA